MWTSEEVITRREGLEVSAAVLRRDGRSRRESRAVPRWLVWTEVSWPVAMLTSHECFLRPALSYTKSRRSSRCARSPKDRILSYDSMSSGHTSTLQLGCTFRSSAWAFSPLDGFRTARITRETLKSKSRRAAAKPMPPFAPVIRAVWPVRFWGLRGCG